MITGGVGGGNTKTGLYFEERTNLIDAIKNLPGYTVDEDGIIYFKKEIVALSLKKRALYNYLLKQGVKYQEFISTRLEPDAAILVLKSNTLYIIEMKFQKIAGSVDEKLQTSAFKLKQYRRLFKPLEITVQYYYILSDWFKQDRYRDVLAHIKEVDCDYFFNELPLDKLGLPSVESPG